MIKLLLIEDNLLFLTQFEKLIQDRYKLVAVANPQKALDFLKSGRVSVVLLDLSSPLGTGIDAIEIIHREIDPHLPIIVLVDQGQTEKAVEAIRKGAYDFVPREIDLEHLSAKVIKALERRDLEVRVNALQRGFTEQQNHFIFASEVMKGINFEITRLAHLPFDVLIEGETGVGKDLAAWQVHFRSARREKSFIPISMKSLNETLIESELFGHEKGSFSGAEREKTGKFEAANGGTIYVPEVSCLTEGIQLKLLYFLQYKSISRVGQDPRKSEIKLNVRLLMATNENLEKLVDSGRLREDFYHRIVGVRLSIPPLRERLEDIEPLVNYFLGSMTNNPSGRKYVVAEDTLQALQRYTWPGNVRELENCVRHALAYTDGPELRPEHFPNLKKIRSGSPALQCLSGNGQKFPAFRDAESEFRKSYFEALLARSDDDVAGAARMAGITPQGLRKILHSLQLR
ncbi:MAG: sigma-54 dependent transcriptional regulator [Bacteroidota bacterium]